MNEVLEYLAADGSSPFGDWFADLDAHAAAKVAAALARLEQGNFSNKAWLEECLSIEFTSAPGIASISVKTATI